jgi:hypothetical protein
VRRTRRTTRTICGPRLLIAAYVLVLSALAVPQSSSAFHEVDVNVEVVRVENLLTGCFDPFWPVCSRPDYFSVVRFVPVDGPGASCPPSDWVENRDSIEPHWVCSRRVQRPLSVRVEIYDFDGGVLPALDGHDHADVTAGAGRDFGAPVELGVQSFAPPGGDTRIEVNISASISSASAFLTAAPNRVDPTLGESVRFRAMFAAHDEVSTQQRGFLQLQVHQMIGAARVPVYVQNMPTFDPLARVFEFIWNGRANLGAFAGDLVPVGEYVAVAAARPSLSDVGLANLAMGQTRFFVESRAQLQLSVLDVNPASRWNPRSGPLEIQVSVGSSSNLTLSAFEGSSCAGPPIFTSIVPAPAGPSTLAWSGSRATGTIAAPGTYSVRVSGVTMLGQPLIPASVCRSVTITEPPTLEMFVEHAPIAPAFGETVEVSATALDAAHEPRRTRTIELWFARYEDMRAGTTPGAPVATCTTVVSCTVAIPSIGRGQFAYRAVARDDDPGPRYDSGWRMGVVMPAPFGAYDASEAIPAGVAIPRLGSFGTLSRTLDIVIAPGSGEPNPRSFVRQLWGFGPPGRRFQSSLLVHQYAVSFWYAKEAVEVRQASGTELCDWSYGKPAWADAAIVIHTVDCRDYAYTYWKVGSANEPLTAWHELHHAAFGLEDEYCCDSNYNEAQPYTNIFPSAARCETERRLNETCTQLARLNPDGTTQTVNWWRFDGNPDVMVNNTIENRGDLRQSDYLFGLCDRSQC